MVDIRWNILKNDRLKKTRGASFEDVLQGTLVAVKKHPSRNDKNIMLIEYKKYLWVVPFVREENDSIFLKTLFPSRKYTKLYKEGEI